MEASTAIEATVVIAAASAANRQTDFYPGLLTPEQAWQPSFFAPPLPGRLYKLAGAGGGFLSANVQTAVATRQTLKNKTSSRAT